MNTQKVTVETAAIRDGDGKIHTLDRPNRHDEVVDAAIKSGANGPFTKGFVISGGRFADRKEAEKIARESGQKTGDLKHPHLGGLSSDDLW